MMKQFNTEYSQYMVVYGNKQFANRIGHEMQTLTQNSVAPPVGGHLAGFLCGYFWQKTVHEQKTAQNAHINRKWHQNKGEISLLHFNVLPGLVQQYIGKE